MRSKTVGAGAVRSKAVGAGTVRSKTIGAGSVRSEAVAGVRAEATLASRVVWGEVATLEVLQTASGGDGDESGDNELEKLQRISKLRELGYQRLNPGEEG